MTRREQQQRRKRIAQRRRNGDSETQVAQDEGVSVDTIRLAVRLAKGKRKAT